MKMTSEYFENAIQLAQLEGSFNSLMSDKKPILTRDFNAVFMNASEFNHVSTHPGSFRAIHASGSGFQTQWYFYHSTQHHKLFMVWVSGNRFGFREDIERIQVVL